MKIPSKLPITAEQSRATRFQLGLTQANVIEQSELPGHKLKNFETGRFVPDIAFLQRLREFYESKGIDFNEVEAKQTNTTPPKSHAAAVTSLSPQLNVGLKVEHYFPISNNITDDVVREAMSMMEENDARLAVLLQTKLERSTGIFSDGELTEDTVAALQETFALLAGNYITFRMLRGWRALNVQPSTENPETVRDMILNTYMQPLIEAGLIVAAEKPVEPAKKEEEAA